MSRHHGLGLYFNDCRFLNGYELRLHDEGPRSLALTAAAGHHAVVQLTNPALSMPDGGQLKTETLGIEWHRMIDSATPALQDRLSFHNFARDSARLTISLSFRAEFEDLYMVRGLVADQPGKRHPPRWNNDALSFIYAGKDGVYRSLTVYFSPAPGDQTSTTARFSIDLEPGETKAVHAALVLRE